MNSETAKPKPQRFPPQVKYIIGNEACERFSYYGIVGILVVYLMRQMGMGADKATETYHWFATAVYFLPLLGGWLADKWLGRYWTILSISVFYCLGHGAMAVSVQHHSWPWMVAGMALIAIGAGGIKPCVSTFVGDQFKPDQEMALAKVYGWFYWAINLGATFAYLLIPYIKDKYGYGWAFGVPGIFMGIATIIFWSGSKNYVKQPPTSKLEKPPAFLGVIVHAMGNQGARKPRQGFLDAARDRYSAEEVEGVKAVFGIVIIFITVPVFWALFNQVNSTWVVQADSMNYVYITATPEFSANEIILTNSEPASALIYEGDLDVPPMARRLKQAGPGDLVAQYVISILSTNTTAKLKKYTGGSGSDLEEPLEKDLNTLIGGKPVVTRRSWLSRLMFWRSETSVNLKSIYTPERFAGVSLTPETKKLLAENPSAGKRLELLNRDLLADAFPWGLSQNFANRLMNPNPDDAATAYVRSQLSPATMSLLANYSGGGDTNLQQALAGDLNKIIQAGPIYDTNRFAGVPLSSESKNLLAEKAAGEKEVLVNRKVLQDAYPLELKKNDEYKIDGELMQAAGSLLVMIWVPILTLLVYPWCEKIGLQPTALRRMGAGMVLGGLSFVASSILQRYLDQGTTLNVMWQCVPYAILEAGEVTISATGLEFAFSQAPPSMKGIIMSLWLMTIAGGHFLVAVITDLNDKFIHAHGANQFWFYAIFQFVFSAVFILLATQYKDRGAAKQAAK